MGEGRPRTITGWNQLAAVSGTFVYAAVNAYLSGGLGAFARAAGLRDTDAGFILSLGALIGIVLAPLWGYLSERWGRRRLILVAVILVLLGPLAMALLFFVQSSGRWFLLAPLTVARAVQAGGGAGVVPLSQAYMADTTGRDRRVRGMGLVGAAISFGAVAGSILLFFVARIGASAGFLALAVAGVASLVASKIWLSEIRVAEPGDSADVRLEVRTIWPFLTITLLGFTAYTIVVPMISIRCMDQLGMSPAAAVAATGIVLTVSSLALALSQAEVVVFGGWRFETVLLASCVAGGAGLWLLVLAKDLLTITIAMITFGLALGQAAPANVAALSNATAPGAQGKAAGFNAAARGVGIAIGPYSGSLLYQYGALVPFWAAAILLLTAATVALVATVKLRPQPDDPNRK